MRAAELEKGERPEAVAMAPDPNHLVTMAEALHCIDWALIDQPGDEDGYGTLGRQAPSIAQPSPPH